MRKIALLVFLPCAVAQIALDNSSTFSSGQNSPPVTSAYTVTSNTNGALIVIIVSQAGTTITNVTYNGVAMSAISGGTCTGTGSPIYSFLLKNPPTGTHNISINDGFTGAIWVAAASFTGVNQTTPIEGTPATICTNNGGNQQFWTGTVTTTTDNDWVVGMLSDENGNTLTAGTNTTLRGPQLGTGAYFSWADTNAAQTPPGSHSIQANYGGNVFDNRSNIAMALVPASGGGGGFTPHFNKQRKLEKLDQFGL